MRLPRLLPSAMVMALAVTLGAQAVATSAVAAPAPATSAAAAGAPAASAVAAAAPAGPAAGDTVTLLTGDRVHVGGRVDRRLFAVTGLSARGFDDADRTPALDAR